MHFKKVDARHNGRSGYAITQIEVFGEHQETKEFEVRNHKQLKEYLKRAHADEVYVNGMRYFI